MMVHEQWDHSDEVLKFLQALPQIRVMPEGPYTETDRARDFLAVFSGTSTPDQGARVLSQIHQICDPAPNFPDANNHGALAWKAGMRRVFVEIMRCMVVRQELTKET